MSDTAFATPPPQIQVRTAPTEGKVRPRQPRHWNVVLLDDDHHTYEYVIRMVQTLFGHSRERGLSIAKSVDKDGRAVCLTTHKEHAELKQEQIHAFGRDPFMIESRGSMSAIIEPAEFGDDSAHDSASNPPANHSSKPPTSRP